MSSDEPVRSVPDELFQQVTARPERQLPDALFGPAPAAPRRPEREEPIRTVPDELFKQATARATRSLPDALFGPIPPPPAATLETADDAAPEEDSLTAEETTGEPGGEAPSEAPASHGSDPVEAVAAEVSPVPGDIAAETSDGEADSAGGRAGTPTTPGDGPDGADEVAADRDAEVSVSAPAEDAAADLPAESGSGTGASAPESLDETTDAPDESAVAASAPADDDSADGVEPTPPLVQETALPAAASTENASADAVPEVAVPAAELAAPANGTVVPASEAGAPAPAEAEPATPRPVLLVIADSLSYFGPKGGLPADDPRIWPNLVAAELDWDVELVARIGWTCRDAYWALIGDPRVWAAVPRAGAVVFAVGGMDTLPSPLPTALREMIRYVRPPRLRRGVRATYNWLQPKLSKLGRPVALPPRVSVGYLEDSRDALAQLRPELPIIGVLPSVHKCDAYGRVHRGRPRAVKALRAWSERTSVPLVDLGEAVRDDIESGDANPDGIHWGWAGHQAVATAMTKTLQEIR